nr:ribosomal protein S20 [Chroomonas debatzensis]
MANNKSSKKRIEINERNRLRNKAYKSTIRTIYKKSMLAIQNLSADNRDIVTNLISLTYSKIDKAVQKRVLHSNAGASKKSSLAIALKKASIN